MESKNPTFHIGCCGWAYFNPATFGDRPGAPAATRLQAYAQLFNTVEINHTFYRFPRLSTAEKWAAEVKAVNPEFAFTLKAYRGITHFERFAGQSLAYFEQLREIAGILQSEMILFQTPPGLAPTPENRKTMGQFFRRLNRHGLHLAFEPRGSWYAAAELIREFCQQHDLIHCVDPFRNDPLYFGREKTGYFRLHGFGKKSMYHYDFSEAELLALKDRVTPWAGKLKRIYIFFNNSACYQNALDFQAILAKHLPGDALSPSILH